MAAAIAINGAENRHSRRHSHRVDETPILEHTPSVAAAISINGDGERYSHRHSHLLCAVFMAPAILNICSRNVYDDFCEFAHIVWAFLCSVLLVISI